MHAKENGFKAFWNIDADDTCFCLSPKRMTELLSTTEHYACSNNIHIFSLDMHRSALEGQHWSNGQLLFPILYYCIGDHTKGMLPIYDDIIKLDINIQDNESIDFLKSTSKEKDLLLCPNRNIETKLCERLKQINAL